MKANVLFAILALCGTTSLYAQEATVHSADTLGVHPYRDEGPIAPKTSNWMLYLDAGGNIFDGDFSSEMLHSIYAPTVGAGLMYNFNSGWGIGVEYLYSMYGATGRKGADNADILLRGQMHRAETFLTFDIFNVWRPQNPRKLFALNLIAGGGAGWFQNDIYYKQKGHTGSQEPLHDDELQCRSFFLGGADFQFNVSRSISIGVKGVYHFFTKDNIDGRLYGNNNDGIFDFTVSMRYKIDAVHKSHVCNVNKDYLAQRVAEERLQAIEDVAKQTRDTTIYQSDTVVINRTVVVKEPVKSEGYYVYFDVNRANLSDIALTTIQQVAARLKAEPNTYAEIIGYCDDTGTEKYNMHLGARRAGNVKEELVKEYEIAPERIIGYSRGILPSKRGKAAYGPNRRAEVHILTKAQFQALQAAQEKEQSEQKTVGTQEQQEPQTPAKTVTFRKGMTLGHLALQEYGDASYWIYIYRANKDKISNPDHIEEGMVLVIPELTAKQRESVHPKTAQVQQEKQESALLHISGKVIATEKTGQDWTLSRMARKHYGNTHCWVYIYAANKSKIANPDRIPQGVTLSIPELTPEQQSITKEQVAEVLAAIRK